MSRVIDDLSPRLILALTLFGEARGEPIDGQIAVACVIRNRVKADLGKDNKPDWWGEGYRGVCLKPFQFSCWNANDPTQEAVMRAAGRAAVHQFDPVMLQCVWIAQGVEDDMVIDIVRGATHYHATTIQKPKWAKGHTPVAQIGHHVFYNDVI